MLQPQRQITINNQKVYYYSIIDLLRLLLADRNYVQGWHSSFEENKGNIEHPANADGFKELHAELRRLYPSHKLVLVNIFLDEYEQHKATKKNIYSIVMTIANVPLKVTERNHFYIQLVNCPIDPTASVAEVFDMLVARRYSFE